MLGAPSTQAGGGGRFHHLPPEFLVDERGVRQATRESDIYMMGMMIYEVNRLPKFYVHFHPRSPLSRS